MGSPSHAVMFHHFYDAKHPKGQGAISADEFLLILQEVERKHPLIDANHWLELSLKGELKDEVCLSFDDGLACQYDVAFPVLQEKGLSAFWFIYSSVLDGTMERLEKYRHFRTTCFNDVDDFYHQFFQKLEEKPELKHKLDLGLEGFNADEYLKDYQFYSLSDKKFRYVRDIVLKEEKYFEVMDLMIEDFDYKISVDDLFVSKAQIKSLSQEGHLIGLHSHTHPTKLSALSKDDQLFEYSKNKNVLESITGKDVVCMSHPCNSYSEETLDVLRSLDIQLGFCSNMGAIGKKGLEFPRQDHANILSQINL